MAMAHTAIEATRSPIITSLTTKSALRNRSEIESGAADGIATPCPATWPRAAEEAKFPRKIEPAPTGRRPESPPTVSKLGRAFPIRQHGEAQRLGDCRRTAGRHARDAHVRVD